MVTLASPSSSVLATPVTVTVWATFQLEEVKVRLAGLTVARLVVSLDNDTVTSAVGAPVRAKAKVPVPPSSAMEVRPDAALVVPAPLHWSLLLPLVPVNPVVHAAQVSVTVQAPRRRAVQSGEHEMDTGSLSTMVVATVAAVTLV